jgi:hypothetical protein
MKFILLVFVFLVSSFVFSQDKMLFFNPSDKNYALVPNDTLMNISKNFTVEFLVKLNPLALTSKNIILQRGECANSDVSYNVQIDKDSSLIFAFNCTGSCNTTNAIKCLKKIIPNQCTNVAITYSSEGVNFYIDGKLAKGEYTQGSFCDQLYLSTSPLRIGAYKSLSGEVSLYFDGLLDDLKIWKKTLTNNEILSNITSKIKGTETDLVLFYDFNENIVGDKISIINQSTTGNTLNALTYSTTNKTPFSDSTSNCFEKQLNVFSLDVESVKIYPNPVKNQLFIENINQLLIISLSNILGQEVIDIHDLLRNQEYIDVSELEPGIYFLNLKKDNEIHSTRFIKEN